MIYRNFTIDAKYPHIDVYRMSTITSKLGLTREKLIVMAIMCGCDYLPGGVDGVGKAAALALMQQWGNIPVFER